MQRVSHAEALTVGPLLAPLLPLGVAASARPAEELARTFAGARVALLLVGQAFRGAAQGECETGEHAVAEQRELASLYVRHVCEPLEALGASVGVIYTHPLCAAPDATARLGESLRRWYDGDGGDGRLPRVLATQAVRSASMGDGWSRAWRLYERHVYRTNGTAFDFVLHARHDLAVLRPLTEWPVADFGKMLFEQQCWVCCAADTLCLPTGVPGSPDSGCGCGLEYKFIRLRVHPNRTSPLRPASACPARMCVADRLMWVPRRFVPLLSSVVHAHRHNGAVVHQLVRPFVHRARLAGAIGAGRDAVRDAVGFLIPPAARQADYFDMHARRDMLAARMRKARGAGRARGGSSRGEKCAQPMNFTVGLSHKEGRCHQSTLSTTP